MSFLRNTLYIFALLIAIAVLALTAIAMLVNPNKMKPIIIDEVKKQTGYQLTIDGNLSWSLYPLLGVKIERMILLAPPQTKPFADLYGVTIATELLQLLHGEQKLLGKIFISEAALLNVRLQKVVIKVERLDKIISMPITAALYDGWLEGVVQGEALGVNPRWNWGMQFTHIQLRPLLVDLNGDADQIKISGRAQVRMDGNTYGVDRQDLFSHLNATINYGVTDGAVEGVDLNYLLQTADALISKNALALPTLTRQTVFESLTGTGAVKNGIYTTNDTVLISTNFTAKAIGNIDLINEMIDLQLGITPTHLEKLKYTIPVDITGSLRHPAINLDTMKMNSLIANEQVEKVKAKVKEQIKQIPSKVDTLMNKILNK